MRMRLLRRWYASLTNLGQDVFATQNTALGMGDIAIVSLAREYAQLIREKTNKRPCIVGGAYSLCSSHTLCR